jgi:hypothetical protein
MIKINFYAKLLICKLFGHSQIPISVDGGIAICTMAKIMVSCIRCGKKDAHYLYFN